MRDVILAAGAGYVVPLLGDIMRMPGLPASPQAERLDSGGWQSGARPRRAAVRKPRAGVGAVCAGPAPGLIKSLSTSDTDTSGRSPHASAFSCRRSPARMRRPDGCVHCRGSGRPGAEPPALRNDRRGAAAGAGRVARAPAAEPGIAHVSGDDLQRTRAALHQPGLEPGLRVQSRGSGPGLSRSGASRPRLRHGVVGPGARARAEHQRGDGPERRACRARAGPEGGRVESRRDAAGTGLHRRACRAVQRGRRRPARPRPRVRGRHEAGRRAVPGRPRRRCAVRGIRDGPPPVGLLDARRHTV